MAACFSSGIGKMVQYGLMPNCTNKCDFCLRLDQRTLEIPEILKRIQRVRDNIACIDWVGEYSAGISLLGGEIYGLADQEYQKAFMELLDDIIEKILKPNIRATRHIKVKYSTVTNGIYNPDFLFQVCDKIMREVTLEALDVNFSYDLKYRYHSEASRKLALENINKFHRRYNYCVGVQMILTQHVIEAVKSHAWDIKRFLERGIPGCQLVFLYPHPVHTGKTLPDFFFKRKDFLEFINWLGESYPIIATNTISSVKHSATFKHTGLFDPDKPADQQPILADGKEILQEKCGHSVLYRCYSDSDACMLCDLLALEG